MSQYEYHKSKTISPPDVTLKNSSIKVNSLEEKTKYVYYKRGLIDSENYECGSRKHKTLKKFVEWRFIGKGCNENINIYELKDK